LVRAALASGLDVRPVPGPSAPIAALTVSGLPTDSFLYLGYLPHKATERRKAVGQIANLSYTLIFLESPYRVVESLEDILEALGDRQICVAREMTKMFEEYWRGTVSKALEHFKDEPARGEFTFVIEGKRKDEREAWTEEELRAEIKKGLKKDKSTKELAAELSEVSGWSRRDIYSLITKP
jgi:16S rRNA (cytidine1402-2'-O)-methyltransferase